MKERAKKKNTKETCSAIVQKLEEAVYSGLTGRAPKGLSPASFLALAWAKSDLGLTLRADPC